MRATLSWSTGTFPPGQLDEALLWAERMGVRAVEINPRHGQEVHEWLGGAAHPQMRCRTEGSASEDADLLPLTKGVRLASLHAWTELAGLAEVAPTAERLAVDVLVVHCRHEALVRDFQACVSQARQWSAWCRDRRMALGLENSSRQPLGPFVRLFEAVPDLKFTLDVKHAYKPETLGLTHADYLRELGDRIVNFHVSGVDRSRDELGDGTPPGRDHIDWQALCADLVRRQYRGLITVELLINRDLPQAQLDAAYAGLPAPPGADNPSIEQRLSSYGVEYFRRQFAPLLPL